MPCVLGLTKLQEMEISMSEAAAIATPQFRPDSSGFASTSEHARQRLQSAAEAQQMRP